MTLGRVRDREFGEAAVRLCGAAAQLLGWRPDEFWRATPADLANALGAFAVDAAALDRDEIEMLRKRFPDAT